MRGDRFSSAGVDRSWTDAVTNKVVLRGLDGSAYLKWLSARSVRLEPIIPQFLHEITHHWCFDSCVGRALALSRMRAGLAVIGMGAGAETRLAADVARYEAAAVLLRPLAEGLALFAELDTRTGGANIVSQPLMALQMCFGFAVQPGPRREDVSLMALLQGSRLKRDFVDGRKAALYFRPFDCADAYLPGYLAVKGLHAALGRRVPEFEDRDLFLCYLRAFVYEDPLLARALLSTGEDELEGANQVGQRIQERLSVLEGHPDLREAVRCFDREVARGNRVAALSAGILASQAERVGFEDAYEYAVRELVSGVDPEEERAVVVAGVVLGNLNLRRFLVVAREDVRVARGSEGAVAITGLDEGVLFTLPDPPDIKGADRAELLVVIPSSAHFLALTLATPEGCTLVRCFGKASAEEREAVCQFASTQELRDGVTDLLAVALDDHVDQSWISLVRNKIRNEGAAIATGLCLSLATLNVSDADLDAVRARLGAAGMRPFLDDDPDLARSLAATGLVNSVTTAAGTVAAFVAALLELDEALVRDGLARLRNPGGFPLVAARGDQVLALV
jgi:hypothetical protein